MLPTDIEREHRAVFLEHRALQHQQIRAFCARLRSSPATPQDHEVWKVWLHLLMHDATIPYETESERATRTALMWDLISLLDVKEVSRRTELLLRLRAPTERDGIGWLWSTNAMAYWASAAYKGLKERAEKRDALSTSGKIPHVSLDEPRELDDDVFSTLHDLIADRDGLAREADRQDAAVIEDEVAFILKGKPRALAKVLRLMQKYGNDTKAAERAYGPGFKEARKRAMRVVEAHQRGIRIVPKDF